MAQILHLSGVSSQSQNTSLTRFYLAGSNAGINPSATETERQVRIRTAGTFSKFYFMIFANDRGASSVKFRKNSANGNQTLAIPASTTGEFEDLVNTDAVISGDDISYQVITGAGGTVFTFSIISNVFASSVNTSQRFAGFNSASFGNADHHPIYGRPTVAGTEPSNQAKFYRTGTLKNGSIFVSPNTRDVSSTFVTRKGGVNQTISITVPAATTGWFEDLVNTDAVVNGDLFNWRMTTVAGTGAVTPLAFCLGFETLDKHFVLGSFGNPSISPSTTTYFPIAGSCNVAATTESNVDADFRIKGTLSNLNCFVAGNTLTADSTFRFRKNLANGNQSVIIPALTTGRFEDIVNTDALIATDEINYQVVTVAGGVTLTIRNMAITAITSAGAIKDVIGINMIPWARP